MKKICDHNSCVGCGVCSLICPVSAITMGENRNGFKFPKIDTTKCVDCGLCVKRCPIVCNSSHSVLPKAEYFGGCAKSIDEVITSTSGGIASVLARVVIQKGGIVFGASYDPFPRVRHIAVSDLAGVDKLKGSKYVESDIQNVLPQIKSVLDLERTALFIGLPCHVAAVRSYIGSENKNLYTIDLICHGKPPQKLFSHWIDCVSSMKGQRVVSYRFRKKSDCGWNDKKTHLHVCVLPDGSELHISNEDNWYGRYFLGGATFRNSCYKCPFAKLPRVGDITLADFWGIESDGRFTEMITNGVSLISVQTQQGRHLMEDAQPLIKVLSVNSDFVLKANRGLVHASKKPLYRRFVYLYVYGTASVIKVCDKLLFGLGACIRKIMKNRG